VALTPTHTVEAGRYQVEGLAPMWVLVVRYWPGDPETPGSIYDISGLGHFPTLRDCKEKATRYLGSLDSHHDPNSANDNGPAG
jgi:hypothetical protein